MKDGPSDCTKHFIIQEPAKSHEILGAFHEFCWQIAGGAPLLTEALGPAPIPSPLDACSQTRLVQWKVAVSLPARGSPAL